MTDLNLGAIDRNSPVPFYFQLAELLETHITSGVLARDSQLPSEPVLCAYFGLSRTTIRQALTRLQQRGLVERLKGQGTFVRRSRPSVWLLQSTDGFFQGEVDLGRTVTSETVRAAREPMPEWACTALDVPVGTVGATIERRRSVDGLVALYVVNHLPEQVADAALRIEDPNESLYQRLHEHAGVEPHGGRRTLEAIAAPDWVAPLLELEPGQPVAFIESVAWGLDLRPFDCYRAWLRTDRTRIDIQVAGPAVELARTLGRNGSHG
jgi:GntR family transcriptional regulator